MKHWIAFWNILVKDMRTADLIKNLPVFLKPLAYALPLTYGADMLHGAVHGEHAMPFGLDLFLLGVFCIGLFVISLWNIKRKWIL